MQNSTYLITYTYHFINILMRCLHVCAAEKPSTQAATEAITTVDSESAGSVPGCSVVSIQFSVYNLRAERLLS